MTKKKNKVKPKSTYEPKLKINGSFLDVIDALVKGKKKPEEPKK